MGSLDMVAFAVECANENTFYVEDSCLDGQLPDSHDDDEIIDVSGSYKTEIKYADANAELRAAAVDIRDNMIARNESFTVTVATTRTDISNLVSEAFQLAVSKELANSSVAGDYLAWHYGGYSFTGKATVKNGVYNYTLTMKVPYYTTLAQENAVTQAVDKALAGMNLNKLDDYSRIKSIYDYVCRVCNYDESKSATDYTRFSAYGAIVKGKAVCQGYSTLLYRMLEQAGYDNKIVTNETHAWNIVKIDDFYFNLDPTWDDTYYNKGLAYHYFLKCNNHFNDHPREAKYKTAAFNKQYPMGDECYLDMLGMSRGRSMIGNEVVEDTLPVTLNKVTATAGGYTAQWTKVDESTGYQMEYSTRSDFQGAKAVYAGATNTVKNTVTGLANGTKYYVRLRAYITFPDGHRLWGDWSESKAVTTPVKPGTPTMSVSAVVDGFKVSWSKIATTTGYQIQYSTRSDFNGAVTVYGGATNTLSNTITGRAGGTKYYVRVRTYYNVADGTRVWGNWTAGKAVTTNVAQGTNKATAAVSKGFKVTWNKIGGVTGYQVQYSTRSDFKGAKTVYAGNGTATTKTVTGLAKNTKYYVRVRAYKNNGGGNYVYGAWSSARAVTTKK